MQRLQIMDVTGHSTIEFDGKDAASLKTASDAALDRIAKGYRIATKTGEGQHELGKAFDPNADTQLLIPPLVGG